MESVSPKQEPEIMVADEGTLPMTGPTAKHVIFKGTDGKVYIRNFKDIMVSTMTLVAFINGEIKDLDAIYYLLPVAKSSDFGSKDKQTHPPGTISSDRWKNNYRGEPGASFKNSIIVDIWTEKKKISTKLSTGKIQMCGPSSLEMGEEASTYIIEHINDAISFIEEIKKNPSVYAESSQWLVDNCKGEKINTQRIFSQSPMTDFVEEVDDNLIEWPTEETIPENYRYFVNNLIYRFDDYDYVSEIVPVIEYFSKLNVDIVSDNLKIAKVGRAMVNYNYRLGFSVNRPRLAVILANSRIHTDFANTVRAHVTIHMRSEVENDSLVVRRGESHSSQVFLVYLSGNVMHSGPGGEAMDDCYYRLMKIIALMESEIVYNPEADYNENETGDDYQDEWGYDE